MKKYIVIATVLLVACQPLTPERRAELAAISERHEKIAERNRQANIEAEQKKIDYMREQMNNTTVCDTYEQFGRLRTECRKMAY